MDGIKTYSSDVLSQDLIAETFKKSYNKDFNFEYWNWRFLKNPNSNKVYISYAIDNDILSSYYAVSPLSISISDKEYKVALSNMTMTHPDYQGKGFFKHLAKVLFEELALDGFVGVYGFANHNSHYGFRKYLNWIDLSVLNTFQLSKDYYKPNLFIKTENLDFEIISLKEEGFSNDFHYHFCESSVVPSRNYETLKWRLTESPDNKYYKLQLAESGLLKAIIVFKQFKLEVDIMECFYHPSFIHEKFEFLQSGISFLLKKYPFVNIWSNLHSEEHLFLEKIGFKEKEFNTYFGIIPFIKDSDILDYKNWHYRFMDSDIY